MGLSSILGRVFFGRISNLKPEWTCRVYQFAMFASGFSSVLFSFSEEYWHILSYVLIYGFLDGSFIGLLSIVTLEIVGLEDMAQGWGMLLFSIAAPIALGPACVGKLYLFMREVNSRLSTRGYDKQGFCISHCQTFHICLETFYLVHVVMVTSSQVLSYEG